MTNTVAEPSKSYHLPTSRRLIPLRRTCSNNEINAGLPSGDNNSIRKQLSEYKIFAQQAHKYRQQVSNSKLNNMLGVAELEVRNLKNMTSNELERSKRIICEQKSLIRLIYEQQKKLRAYHAALPFQSESELLKTQLQKDTLESQIGILDQELRLKKKELQRPAHVSTSCSYPSCTQTLTMPAIKKPDEVLKLMNERDMLKHHLVFDKSYKEVATKELERELATTRDELSREQRLSRDKMTRLEEELTMTKSRLEDALGHKSDLLLKITALENRMGSLQMELEKKDVEKVNTLENAEKHFSSLCHQLNSQIEDLRRQLKLAEEKNKRLEHEFGATFQKTDYFMSQIASLKQELDASNECNGRLKRNFEDQINSYAILEKKQSEEIRELQENLKRKQGQFECFQRELELALTPKLEERIKHEKLAWEHESKHAIQRELAKLNEEKCRELSQLQHELVQERERVVRDREMVARLEKKIEELNQALKISGQEKQAALGKARDMHKAEIQKLKIDLNNEKQDELNRLRRMIKELEDELTRRSDEYKHERDKNLEMIASIDKFEKSLIKEMNEEQRKLASIGLTPKLVKYSSSGSFRNNQNALSLETFQTAFANSKSMLEELTQKYQKTVQESEQTRKNLTKIVQEKEQAIEGVKRQCERQKQKELETLRESICKDEESLNKYTVEISSLVKALKSKDNEIRGIQENMGEWKRETLNKLAEKFECELKKELDRRMEMFKSEQSSNQQAQLDSLRKELDQMLKESQISNQNKLAQEQNGRMVRYLQSRLNDLRNENLSLRDKFKSSTSFLNESMTGPGGLFAQDADILVNCSGRRNREEESDRDESMADYTDEMLQQKIKDLQTLQLQLSNVKA